MDSKRKANGAGAAGSPDRSAKRRKVTDFDLSKGESRDSTTAYGHAFLEQIRRTADKSGRQVAKCFEILPPRAGNAEYYKRTKMPISLQKIEEKLDNGEFRDLAELESYFKRMIANAKEFYPRSSQVFDDAERVRKALSNYMTKTNPAYGTRGYQALPTALPGEGGDDEEEEEEEGDVEAEDDDDEDAEEEEEEEDDEDDEDDEPTKRRSIVLKRRGPGRPPKNPVAHAESRRQSALGVKQDHEYHGVPYKGLSFQDAQEKLVEELLRYNAPEYDGYFEPFVNLPPRALKDYYKVITDPLSLKKFQKEIKGVHGRNDATGVTDYKSWSAFRERAKLLWTNAYYYNEEGSEIYDLAQELEKAFHKQLKEAQAAVSEPAQPKIKLKSTQQSVDTPTPQTNGARQPAIEATRSASASAPSPTPSSHAVIKGDESARGSPAVFAQGPGTVPGPQPTPVAGGRPPYPGMPQQMMPPVPVVPYVEPKRLRAAGKGVKDALISRLRIQLHPGTAPTDDPVVLDVLPLPREMQQSGTVNVPSSLTRVFVVPQLPEFLQERQYSLWVMIDKQPLKPIMQQLPNFLASERVFDVVLHPGVNIIEAHLVAAVPKEEREHVGSEVELEVFTAYVNVLRT